MARRKAPRIPDALLDQLLAGADLKTAFDANGLLDDLKKALAERARIPPVRAALRGMPRIVEHRTYGQAYEQCFRAARDC